jgi:acetoin utilization deacetylase AcuC-like enzyme
MRSAYISHPSCVRHDMGAGHPECPARVQVIADRLLASGLLDLMTCLDAPAVTREQVERAHGRLLWPQLQAAGEAAAQEHAYAQIDPDTVMNPHTWNALLHAAGAGVLASELVLGQGYSRVFCNVRPPGHHAERDRAMGFCFFDNVAVAALHALEAFGLARVAIADFDVHHGNGTEDIFAGDERVLMVSTFQHHLYPGTGDVPRGPNMRNVPLPAYSDGRALRVRPTVPGRTVSG